MSSSTFRRISGVIALGAALVFLNGCNTFEVCDSAACYYNSGGGICSTGNPSPGCDYTAYQTKMTASSDPYFNPNNYTAGTWTSPDGVEYSTGGPNGVAINSVEGRTKDTDLEKANQQKSDLDLRARAFAQRFQMSVRSSTQLVQIADRLQAMAQQGQLTDDDRAAVVNAAFGVAGVTLSDVNDAVRSGLGGNGKDADALLAKAAKNLGMPSSSALRDQLLPALGY